MTPVPFSSSDAIGIYKPQQIEFARLNLTYTMMSKRKLLELVQGGYVSGWNDPRMPTIAGIRRRGYTPESLRNFCAQIGVSKYDGVIGVNVLENAIREDLNKRAPRVMAVLYPLKVVITNYPEGKVEMLDAVNNPEDPNAGTRQVPFSREIYVEQDDFREVAPKKYYRLAPGQEVRLRWGYLIRCTDFVKDPTTGQITEIHCTYDPETRGGNAPDGRKVQGTIHWVSGSHAASAEVRLYDHLFKTPDPDDAPPGADYKVNLNPESLVVLKDCKLEPSLAKADAGSRFQFERVGYFCVDPIDSRPGSLVFNRTVSLRDTWAKIEKQEKKSQKPSRKSGKVEGMTDADLESLLDDVESDRVERKETFADGDRVRQAVCAFANDLPRHDMPGVVFIGVSDNGQPTGLNITDQLLQDLASMRGDGNVLPFPSLDVQKRNLKGRDVAVVIVYPSIAPPVRFKGAVWIRSGPRRGIANPDDERRLNEKRRFRDLPVDVRPLMDAELDTINELVFRLTYLPSAVALEVLEQNQRTLVDQLVASKFAHPGPPVKPTVLGILTVGKSPTDWVPGAYIQFLRIDGTALGDPVRNQREIRGSLPELLSETEDLLKNNIQSSADFTTSAIETRVSDYPIVALQQIVRNAILHRSYENTNAPVRVYWFNDRVEVQNPGGPYGQVTRQNFGHAGANDYRNPNLAAVMKELGYVQRFGYGIALARREMEKNGNPPPEFQVEDAHVAVILRKHP